VTGANERRFSLCRAGYSDSVLRGRTTRRHGPRGARQRNRRLRHQIQRRQQGRIVQDNLGSFLSRSERANDALSLMLNRLRYESILFSTTICSRCLHHECYHADAKSSWAMSRHPEWHHGDIQSVYPCDRIGRIITEIAALSFWFLARPRAPAPIWHDEDFSRMAPMGYAEIRNQCYLIGNDHLLMMT
jgi:hypothetical protein